MKVETYLRELYVGKDSEILAIVASMLHSMSSSQELKDSSGIKDLRVYITDHCVSGCNQDAHVTAYVVKDEEQLAAERRNTFKPGMEPCLIHEIPHVISRQVRAIVAHQPVKAS